MPVLKDSEAILWKISNRFCKVCNNYTGTKCKSCDIGEIKAFVNEMPEADARTKRYGTWEGCGAFTYRCDACGGSVKDSIIYDLADEDANLILNLPGFCPMCGAEMERE